ncbi:MAG: hypothetical protein MJY95_08245 [Bacteroidaceae bacterium]|nr:hypothetical protein [Bacteroidaceae bacterium]
MTLEQLEEEIRCAIGAHEYECSLNGGHEGSTASFAELQRVITLCDLRVRYFGKGYQRKRNEKDMIEFVLYDF